MRIESSLKNMITSLCSNIITIIIGLIAQALFIKILGSEYLGLNSLFSNIISMLAIAEMGIGSAIIYNLYKPVAENDEEKIKSLMQFYKKSYRLIGIIVCLIGVFIIPFLNMIIDIDAITININPYAIYLLFLIETTCSYFLSYKRSILYANQKNYIINIIHIFYTIILNYLQIIILYLTQNYYLYLIIKIAMRIIENTAITYISNRTYNYLSDKGIKPLDKIIQKDIFNKVKALFFHKIGSFIVLGTDNIIISKFLGLTMVGLYSNYYLIINSVQTIFNQIIQSTTASIGNMLVTESKEKQFYIYKKIRFMNFWISTFTSIAILVIMDSFVAIWIGKEYILPTAVLVILVINYYMNSSRSIFSAFKEAAGIYYEDRFVPLLESTINIIASIVFVKIFGLAGVFLGTIMSGLVLWCFSYPKFVYKRIFKGKYIDYIKENLGYLLLFIIIAIGTYYISAIINFNNIWLKFFSNILIALIIPNIAILVIFSKTDNFQYFIKIIKSIICRKKEIN